MKMMNSVFYHDHTISCPKCKASDTLELYDKNNRPINYNELLYTHDKSLIDHRSIRYFKCKKCKSIFKIDWSGIVPIPLDETKIDHFIENCKEIKEK